MSVWPVPASTPPVSTKLATDSLPPRVSWPLEIVRPLAALRRPPEPSVVVPVDTVIAPVPNWELTAPPWRA